MTIFLKKMVILQDLSISSTLCSKSRISEMTDPWVGHFREICVIEIYLDDPLYSGFNRKMLFELFFIKSWILAKSWKSTQKCWFSWNRWFQPKYGWNHKNDAEMWWHLPITLVPKSEILDLRKINTLVLILDEFENDRPVGRSFSRKLSISLWLILIGDHFSIRTKF